MRRPSRSRLAAGLLVALAALAPLAAAAQCGQCDFLITGRDGGAYSATAGNTVCVDRSAVFTGSVTLAGGRFENCGTALPSSIRFGAPAAGGLVNYGTLRYFRLELERATLDNHRVLLTYDDLRVGPGAGLVNHESGVMAVGGELLNRGVIANLGVLDTGGGLLNRGRLENDGLLSANRRLDNEGELVNRGRINASELFRNAAGRTFRSEGGTLAAFDLVNEGTLSGEPSAGCNSFLLENQAPLPDKGRLVGSLDFCATGSGGLELPGRPDTAAVISRCGCFNR